MAKRHEQKAQIPTKDEIRGLLAKSAELWSPTQPWRALILTALFSGLRASELRGLTWDCVDFEEKLIRVRQRADFKNKLGSPKSAAGVRDVPMPPVVINTLQQWRLTCPKSAQNPRFPDAYRRHHCEFKYAPPVLASFTPGSGCSPLSFP
jgi:integrase